MKIQWNREDGEMAPLELVDSETFCSVAERRDHLGKYTEVRSRTCAREINIHKIQR
jgi:hypothetical protein